jgi:predicted ATPase
VQRRNGSGIILPTDVSGHFIEAPADMISSLQIHGYRGLLDFEMSGLKRVNLLVGRNNSGKTSVLEGVYLLATRGDPNTLWQVLWRRGERLSGSVDRTRDRAPDLDVSHLFTGHGLRLGASFRISAKNQTPERSLVFTLSEIKSEKVSDTNKRERLIPSRVGLELKGTPTPMIKVMPLSQSGGFDSDVLQSPRRIRRELLNEFPAQFITAESLDGSDLISLWDKVALTQNEERVITALQFLDLDVERIAPQVGGGQFYYPRGGFIVKVKGDPHPVPIGTMGDGMWRMLAMAIAIAHCKDGVLLVDEIDTGLHYTVMANMWQLIFRAAADLNVQVFATTHSSDCIRSLAELCNDEASVAENVTLQRIEAGNPKAVPYTAEEIEIAAERRVEVR